MTNSSDHTTKKSECHIAEILQHTCIPESNSQGQEIMQCFPILRIFKLCKGQPAVEITRFINVDPTNGAIEIPAGFKTETVQGRSWREIERYDKPDRLDDL
ncbi:hypothetical protein BJ912DRAFT_845642 [Pholiota molesta]|nr:hypothetical protein BJ912DRAFT_845642 [Pholiota molesta]